MPIYLIRHPPAVDVDGLCYGRLDVRVERKATIAAAESIRGHFSTEALAAAAIYSSPSTRCLELARHLAAPRQPEPADDLAEMDFGQWQGRRWDAIARNEIDAWAQDVWNYRPGGGESAQMVASRWERWSDQVRQRHAGDVIAITHAGVIRVALACRGRTRDSQALGANIPFASIHRLDLG